MRARDAAARSSTGDPALERRRYCAVAKKLRRDGDTTGRVAAYVVERTAVLRDRAAGEKAALAEAEAERTAGALAEFIAALIETVRTLCRAALGRSGPPSPPSAANVRHRGRPRRHRPRRPGAGPQPSALATVAHAMMQDQAPQHRWHLATANPRRRPCRL